MFSVGIFRVGWASLRDLLKELPKHIYSVFILISTIIIIVLFNKIFLNSSWGEALIMEVVI